MPSAVSPPPRNVSNNLSDFDDAVADFMKDLPIEKSNTNNSNAVPIEPTKDIDEEVKIKKKRKPIPKLDETRLLSQDGIPRLRKITKSRLRFKGKGHEFSDISRLLNMYQLWLDDLYPRAKLRDALGMVEKVGHSKRMKVMRKAWLDDTKPYRKDAEADVIEPADFVMSGALPNNGDAPGTSKMWSDDEDDIFIEGEREQVPKESNHEKTISNDDPDEDELDALLAETNDTVATVPPSRHRARTGPFMDDSDDDELDALLAAESARNTNTVSAIAAKPGAEPLPATKESGDDFADEEEVMAGMDMW